MLKQTTNDYQYLILSVTFVTDVGYTRLHEKMLWFLFDFDSPMVRANILDTVCNVGIYAISWL